MSDKERVYQCLSYFVSKGMPTYPIHRIARNTKLKPQRILECLIELFNDGLVDFVTSSDGKVTAFGAEWYAYDKEEIKWYREYPSLRGDIKHLDMEKKKPDRKKRDYD